VKWGGAGDSRGGGQGTRLERQRLASDLGTRLGRDGERCLHMHKSGQRGRLDQEQRSVCFPSNTRCPLSYKYYRVLVQGKMGCISCLNMLKDQIIKEIAARQYDSITW
jgi:hypothetical protein